MKPRLSAQWRAFLMAVLLKAHLDYVAAEQHRVTTALMARALGLTWKEVGLALDLTESGARALAARRKVATE